MSIIVPSQDLAPSVASRIVALKFAELHEGPLEGPASVTFTLPGDLRVPADDVIIRAGAVTVELDANGEGQVRLPTHDPEAIGDGVGSDWYLLVKKSWNQQVDMIRVPAGAGSISLADIAPVVEVTPAMGQWLVTNATVTMTEGSSWAASVTVAGGIARFAFTVPPGGAAWKLGILPINQNALTLADGAHQVGSGSAISSLQGPPQLPSSAWLRGILEKFTNSAGEVILRFTASQGSKQQVWQTVYTASAWKPWEPLMPDTVRFRGILPAGNNADAMRGTPNGTYEGQWQIVPANLPTGLPADFSGNGLLMVWPGVGWQTLMDYGADPKWMFRGINNASTGAWSAWRSVFDSSTDPTTVGDALERTTRTDAARTRVGNKIGTAGKAVVMLRFDDYPDTLLSKVIPVLAEHQLPSYFACTVNHVENLSSVTWPQLQTAALANGMQITGHSWSHGNQTSDAGIAQEIVDSADYFEQQMPGIRVDVWTQPSVGGAVPYDDYSGDADAEFFGTNAGRLLLSRYAVVNGARGGWKHPQGGGSMIGSSNMTYETFDLATFQDRVLELERTGSAADLMLHPGRLDEAGYMTSATFAACMAWLAAERDAGRVLVLSGLAKAVLDGGSTYRHDMIDRPVSAAELNGWNATGWTNVGDVFTSPGTTGRLSKAFIIAGITGAAGSVREFSVLVRAAAAATVRLEAVGTNAATPLLSKSVDHNVAGDGKWHRIRASFIVPASGDTHVSFYIGSPTSNVFDVWAPSIHAYAV